MSTYMTAHYNLWLVILAAAICTAGSLSSFTIYAQVISRAREHVEAWLLLAGFCAGASIWATHFIAMLAYETGLPTGYDLTPTIISFALVMTITTLGFRLSQPARRAIIGGSGAMIGLGAAAMHFIGLRALTVAGDYHWNNGLVILSILFSMGFSAAALLIFREWRRPRAYLAAASLFTLGICLLHFTAMAALTIEAPQDLPTPDTEVDTALLAVAIAGVTGLILLAGYTVALIYRRARRESIARTRDLVDAAVGGLIIAKDGVTVRVNGRVLELCGRKSEELIGKGVFEEILSGVKLRSPVGAQQTFAASLVQADGTKIPVEVLYRPLRGLSRGNEIYALQDRREKEAAARQLAEANQELARREEELRARDIILGEALGAMSQGLCVCDSKQRVVVCNERFSTLYGLPPDAIQPGMHLREVVKKRTDNGIYAGSSPTAYRKAQLRPVIEADRTIHELNDGRLIAIAQRPMPAGGWLSTHEDITEQKRMESQLKQLADHDSLTGLLSRTAFRDVLAEALQTANKRDRRVAVFAAGIDRFNEINDTLGHATGDGLLKAIAARLRESTKRSTTVGRLGENTFGIIEFVEHPEKDAAGFANRTLDEIRKPIIVGESRLEVTATIGIATSPVAGKDADALMKNAALAQKLGEIESHGTYHFFDPVMERDLKAKRALEQQLKKALQKHQFVLHYQPRANLTRNDVVGFEAVLRWQHPHRGLLEPDVFLPVAEKLGLIGAIEEWMLQRACADAMNWPTNLTLAVSVSAAQILAHNFIRSVINVLASTGLSADRLQLEVSERVVRNNAEKATNVLRKLSDFGVRITITDFGSGLSSLSYVRQLPVHKIKIDRNFVSGLEKEADTQLIVRMLARFGAGLGMETMVEGVETQEQLDLVRAEGYTEMQGDYFSAPKTSEEVSQIFLAKDDTVGNKRSAQA